MWGVSPSERAGKVISSTHIGVPPLFDWKAKNFSLYHFHFTIAMWGDQQVITSGLIDWLID
jgi:hypothetical protein